MAMKVLSVAEVRDMWSGASAHCAPTRALMVQDKWSRLIFDATDSTGPKIYEIHNKGRRLPKGERILICTTGVPTASSGGSVYMRLLFDVVC